MKQTQWTLRLALTLLLFVFVGFIYYNVSSPLALYPEEARELLRKGYFDAVVDVRTKAERATGHYPLDIHVPVQRLTEDLPKRIPDTSARILFYCNTSTRARVAAEKAEGLGYKNVRYLIGTHMNLKN
jgi:rhodanese-related sulfurtransferase